MQLLHAGRCKLCTMLHLSVMVVYVNASQSYDKLAERLGSSPRACMHGALPLLLLLRWSAYQGTPAAKHAATAPGLSPQAPSYTRRV